MTTDDYGFPVMANGLPLVTEGPECKLPLIRRATHALPLRGGRYSRCFELRAEGLGDREAITKAVGLTGPTISCAGVIMALAFAGMLVGTNKYADAGS